MNMVGFAKINRLGISFLRHPTGFIPQVFVLECVKNVALKTITYVVSNSIDSVYGVYLETSILLKNIYKLLQICVIF